MATKEEAIRSILQKNPLFAELTEEHLDQLVELFEIEEVGLGKPVAEEGQPIEAMHVVYKGSLRLKKLTEDGKRKSVGKIKTGAAIGEDVFLPNSTWPYDVSSADQTTLLKLSREAIGKFLEANPDMAQSINNRVAMDSIFKKILMLIGDSPEADSLKQDLLPKLKHYLGVLHVEQGQTIYQQNKDNSNYYLLHRGQVELLRETVEGKISLGTIDPDEYFGEAGIITGRRQDTTALALTSATVIVIPFPVVYSILQVNAGLRQGMIDRMEYQREEEIEQIKLLHRHREQAEEAAKADQEEKDKKSLFKKPDKRIKKFPWIRQHDETDCGAACLTMISRFYGVRLSMGRVREIANVTTSGASMSAMLKAGEALGYRTRGLKCSYSALGGVNLPAIIHWEGFHWVVLYHIDAKHVWLADPDRGHRKLSKEDFLEGWTGYVIEIEPTETLKDIPQAKHPIFYFARYLLPYRGLLAEIGLAALIINLLGLASPLFLQAIIDSVIVNQDISLLNMMLLGMVLVTFFSSLTSGVQSFLSLHITTRLDLRMLADYYRHILSLPMSFFGSRKKGDILTRFGENSTIRSILTDVSISVVLSVLMIVVYTSLMVAYSPMLSLVAFAFIPGFIALTLIFSPIFVKLSNEAFMSNAEQSSIMVESISAIETIKANAIEWAIRQKWENHYIKMVNLTYRNAKVQLIAGVLRQILNTASSIVILWLGAHLVIDNRMTVGELMGFNTLLGSVMAPIMSLVSLWDTYKMATVSMDRVNDVLETEPEQVDKTKEGEEEKPRIYLRDINGEIEFDNVSFRYGDRDSPLVLNGLNLKINAGETVAFVGKSGCGKSTMIRLIMGFYMPTEGSLRIDGKDIKNLDLITLRRNIGMVLQDSFLFSGSVADNIALGEDEPDEDALVDAAKLASAHEFIVNLPGGYKTMVGEKGLQLSGGQRQRVCIARALYHKPQIIIFDEATSALDTESERRIQENMNQILAGRTAVMIAHRLSTVRNADKICYLDRGVIAELGTHDELVKKKGLYYNLAHQQLGGD